MTDLGTPRRVLQIGFGIPDDFRQRGRLREVEDARSAGVRVVAVREVRLRWQARRIHRRLPLDARQGRALGLGLDDPDNLPLDVEEVVGPAVARLHDHLTAGHAIAGEQVQAALVLHRPTGVSKLTVDEHACTLLRRQLPLLHIGIHRCQPMPGMRFRGSGLSRAPVAHVRCKKVSAPDRQTLSHPMARLVRDRGAAMRCRRGDGG